jgi:hypothetical protein
MVRPTDVAECALKIGGRRDAPAEHAVELARARPLRVLEFHDDLADIANHTNRGSCRRGVVERARPPQPSAPAAFVARWEPSPTPSTGR